MTADLPILITAILAAPFGAALLAVPLHRLLRSLAGWVLALVPALAFAQLVGLAPRIAGGEAIVASYDWVKSLGLVLRFRLDGLSLVFALAVTGIGALILVYSAAYLKTHPHQGRFLAFMLLFMGAMLGLVLADTMLALFGFWELTSIASFLLIGFDHMRQMARRAAIQAVVVTGIGGLGLLAAVVVLHGLTGTWDLSGLDGGLRGLPAYPLVLGLVLLAAFTKSAQVPFHFWLPSAMEAPTPVSAFLHSATMVQAGVYLLARLSPSLGGTPLWMGTLVLFGTVTLLWGGVVALRQTDLKQMLAHSTIAALGLLVLMLGLGGELAVTAAMLFFVAHALYKAALFLVVGVVDHETGTRDLTVLGGLADKLPASFIAAAAAAFSMLGLPASIGFLAKEELYRALTAGEWQSLTLLAACVAGSAIMGGIGLIVAIRPFLGPDKPTPKPPHENSVGLLVGPVALGAAGLVGGVLFGLVGDYLSAPAAAAVLGRPVEGHLNWELDPASPVLWLSLATWALAALVFNRAERFRLWLRRIQGNADISLDIGFDWAMFGLIRLSAALTRLFHHGRLELYLLALFAMLALALLLPLPWGAMPLPAWTEIGRDIALHEWGILALAVLGLLALLLARTRLVAILSLGAQGLALALIFLLRGAPDLAFTQVMIEILSVVILALVMIRLRLDRRDPREFEDLLRDGGVALACGIGLVLALWAVLARPMHTALADFFARTGLELAHGRNIVNVIIVDYRGLDTLGEITVVMAAGIGIMLLLRRRKPEASA